MDHLVHHQQSRAAELRHVWHSGAGGVFLSLWMCVCVCVSVQAPPKSLVINPNISGRLKHNINLSLEPVSNKHPQGQKESIKKQKTEWHPAIYSLLNMSLLMARTITIYLTKGLKTFSPPLSPVLLDVTACTCETHSPMCWAPSILSDSQGYWIDKQFNKEVGLEQRGTRCSRQETKKKETMSDKEDCAGKIINEWLRQIIQAVTVGPLVLLLLRITRTQRHTNKGEEEELRSGSKRNLIVIYQQTFP